MLRQLKLPCLLFQQQDSGGNGGNAKKEFNKGFKQDWEYLVKLTSFAIGRDEGVVGGCVGSEALLNHSFVHVHCFTGLMAHVVADHECVVRPQNRLYPLR